VYEKQQFGACLALINKLPKHLPTRMRIAASLLLAFSLGGCTPFPRQMVGQFNSRQDDFIVIRRDGSLYWSPKAKNRDRLNFVGIAVPDKNDPGRVRIIVPSTSPFLSSSANFSSNHSHLTIDWGTYAGKAARMRSTEYERATSK